MKKLEICKYSVLQNFYVSHMEQTLYGLPDGKNILLMLSQKNGSYSDSIDVSPVFFFPSELNVIKEMILEWATDIASKHRFSPKLKIDYMLLIGPARAFDQLFELPGDALEDKDLLIALRKFKSRKMGIQPVILSC